MIEQDLLRLLVKRGAVEQLLLDSLLPDLALAAAGSPERVVQLFAVEVGASVVIRGNAGQRGAVHHRQLKHHRLRRQSFLHPGNEVPVGRDLAGDQQLPLGSR